MQVFDRWRLCRRRTFYVLANQVQIHVFNFTDFELIVLERNPSLYCFFCTFKFLLLSLNVLFFEYNDVFNTLRSTCAGLVIEELLLSASLAPWLVLAIEWLLVVVAVSHLHPFVKAHLLPSRLLHHVVDVTGWFDSRLFLWPSVGLGVNHWRNWADWLLWFFFLMSFRRVRVDLRRCGPWHVRVLGNVRPANPLLILSKMAYNVFLLVLAENLDLPMVRKFSLNDLGNNLSPTMLEWIISGWNWCLWSIVIIIEELRIFWNHFFILVISRSLGSNRFLFYLLQGKINVLLESMTLSWSHVAIRDHHFLVEVGFLPLRVSASLVTLWSGRLLRNYSNFEILLRFSRS